MKKPITLNKARRAQKNRRQCRTFAGYIGLIDGRPDVEPWPNAEGLRTVHVFLNERKAKQMYEAVALVTITGVWEAKGHVNWRSRRKDLEQL